MITVVEMATNDNVYYRFIQFMVVNICKLTFDRHSIIVEFYRAVHSWKRLSNDPIVILCLPNVRKILKNGLSSLINDICLNENNAKHISLIWFFIRGQLPADAEVNYLRVASTLDMYGVELHKTSVKVNILI